jgi:UDP-glucose 4-epimerase
MNVLVTGSHGYIGSVLCKTLTEAGHRVFACDTKQHLGGNFDYLYTVYHRSFDDDEVLDVIDYNQIDTIFHLAASSLLGPSATDPLLYYHNNTARTINLLNKLREREWKGHIIFSSTAAVYGDQGSIVTENASILQPCNHYGHSKLMCEQAINVAHMYGIKTTTFRYFNVAGAYDDRGQDAGEPHIITRICNAVAGKAPLTVFGIDYKTKDGTCIRDYVHVRDVCRAQIHAMDNKVEGIYNLGTQDGTSVLEIINAFEDVNKVNVEFQSGMRRTGDPAYLVAAPWKFMDTGFEYKHSTIEEIVKSAWSYYNGI